MHLSTLIIPLFLSGISSAKRFSKSKDAVLLSQVRSLTLRDGKITSHRRVEAIQQLACIGGNARGLHEVDVMRCTNSGSEYNSEDIQWTCQASLPPEFKLGSTDVVCEDYDGPDDPYILKGSCGVEYRLVLTEVGEKKYKAQAFGKAKDQKIFSLEDEKLKKEKSDSTSSLFQFLFIVAVLVALYVYYSRNIGPQNVHIPTNFGGGGGGGGGGDDPPPPYSPQPPPRPKQYPQTSRTNNSSARTSRSGPGFWTGAATGAATGYGAGYYMGSRNQTQPGPSGQRAARSSPPPRQGGSSWFGGGGRSNPPAPRSPPTSPPSPPSTSHYESTGFGGTRRR